MAGDDRDPCGQGELGFLRAPRRRGRGAGPRDHRGARRAGRRGRGGAGRRRHADRLPLRLVHGRAGGRGARVRARCGRCSTPSTACATSATSRRSSASSSRSAAAAPSRVYVDVDGKNSDRMLFNVVQGGLGLPDESYYHDEKFAEIREKYVAFLTRMFELVERPDAAAAAATVMAVETRLSQGHWERAETRDVQKTYNLLTLEELHALCPAFDWEAFIRNLGGSEETIAETCVRQPSYLEHLSTALEEVPIEDWRAWLAARVVRAYAPYLAARVRRDQLRLLRPHPGRHAGAARAVEARRRAGRGLDRRGGRARVRRPPLPAGLQGDDGRPGRQPAACLPAVDLGAGLDERRDQAGGVREARPVPLEDRLPRDVPRLLRRWTSSPTTCSATSRRPRRSRPGASSPRSALPSTATSG